MSAQAPSAMASIDGTSPAALSTSNGGIHPDVTTAVDHLVRQVSEPQSVTVTPTADSASAGTPVSKLDELDHLPCLAIQGLKLWAQPKEVIDKFVELQLPYAHIHKGQKDALAVVYFTSEDDKSKAWTTLEANRHCFAVSGGSKSRSEQRIRVREVPPNLHRKRKATAAAKQQKQQIKRQKALDGANDQNGNSDTESRNNSDNDAPAEAPKSVVDSVAPLAHIPYDEQLRQKHLDIQRKWRKQYRQWKQQYKLSNPYETDDGLLSPLLPIIPSPTPNSYRNKCEFTIGLNHDNQPECGFQMGRYVDNRLQIESPKDCPNIANVALSVAAIMTAFLRSPVCKYPVFDKTDKSGVWRLVTVRNSERTGDLMVCVMISVEHLPEAEAEQLKQTASDHFVAATSTAEWKAQHPQYSRGITSLLIRMWSGRSDGAPDSNVPEVLANTQSQITEQLSDLKFRLTLQSFFQINVPTAEILYKTAIEWIMQPLSTPPKAAAATVDAEPTAEQTSMPDAAQPKAHRDIILFDVCSGAGSIGLSMAHHVKQLIGLEIVEQAVEDARHNAELNSITNATFIAGAAEKTLPEAIRKYAPKDSNRQIVAIVDPPRSGLHTDVLRILRSTRSLQKLVYISCNPKTLIIDLEKLIKPASQKYSGEAWQVVKAQPVDMFPHTPHCEMVVLLERQ